MLPEHDVLVVDEAHELTDRVTSVATAELARAPGRRGCAGPGRLIGPELVLAFGASGRHASSSAIHETQPGRIDHLDDELAVHLTALRDAGGVARSSIDPKPPTRSRRRPCRDHRPLSEITETAAWVLESFTWRSGTAPTWYG